VPKKYYKITSTYGISIKANALRSKQNKFELQTMNLIGADTHVPKHALKTPQLSNVANGM
jgi:hypothetical protein